MTDLDLQARVTVLEGALRKVRAHTGFEGEPPLALLRGLVKSIERITDATITDRTETP